VVTERDRREKVLARAEAKALAAAEKGAANKAAGEATEAAARGNPKVAARGNPKVAARGKDDAAQRTSRVRVSSAISRFRKGSQLCQVETERVRQGWDP
jgi:hypothetical protein